MPRLIHQGRILQPNGEFWVGDVEVRDRQIIQVAPEIRASAMGDSEASSTHQKIDATGLTLLPSVTLLPGVPLLPGVIDP